MANIHELAGEVVCPDLITPFEVFHNQRDGMIITGMVEVIKQGLEYDEQGNRRDRKAVVNSLHLLEQFTFGSRHFFNLSSEVSDTVLNALALHKLVTDKCVSPIVSPERESNPHRGRYIVPESPIVLAYLMGSATERTVREILNRRRLLNRSSRNRMKKITVMYKNYITNDGPDAGDMYFNAAHARKLNKSGMAWAVEATPIHESINALRHGHRQIPTPFMELIQQRSDNL